MVTSKTESIPHRSAGIDRRWWALVATAASLLVVGLDTTILNVALPDIAVQLNASSAGLQWFADSYLLALGALLLPAGLLGDRFGRKRFTLLGLAVFGIGSLWCALSTTAGSLVAARTLLGVGAAVLVPLAMSAVVVLFEPEERGRAITVLSASTMLGLPLGPVVAGVLLQHFWWGSVFLVNVPVVIAAAVAVAFLLPETRATDAAARRPIDLLGVVLSSAGMLALTYGVIEGPERGWTDRLVLGCVVGSVMLFGAFAGWEHQVRGVEPVVDRALLRIPAFRWGTIAAAVASLAFFGVMFVVPQYLRGVLGADALGTGLRLLPMVAGLLVGLRGAVALLPLLGSRVLGTTGFVVAGAGMALGTRVTGTDAYALTAVWTALAGAGIGAALLTAQNGALGHLPRERAASGSALIQTMRQVGSVIGIAGLGALLNAVYRSNVDVSGLPTREADSVRDSLSSGIATAQTTGTPELAASVRAAFVEAMAATLWVSAVVCVLGAILVWCLLPDARTMTGRVAHVDAPESEDADRTPIPGDSSRG